MAITFENDNDVIVYALEKIISYARRTQQIFVAQCIWWLASLIGLEKGLENHIDNLQSRSDIQEDSRREEIVLPTIREVQEAIPNRRAVSTVPRDFTEDQRLHRILESAERVIQESFRGRFIVQQGRVNPLPTTKKQLKKARRTKRLEEKDREREVERSQRLREIRATVIRNLSKE